MIKGSNMFGFGKKKNSPPPIETEKKHGLFKRLVSGLSKTRARLTSGITDLLASKKTLDTSTLDELETLLLSADIGVKTTQYFIEELKTRFKNVKTDDETTALDVLKSILLETLKQAECDDLDLNEQKPFIMMMIGVNGSGKTTTTGKLAAHFRQEGLSVMLAAADTFRAAAIEQLQAWGERNQVQVVAQHSGSDSAAVCFDAIQSAKAKKLDILIADTAGRLHTQSHLMEELKKIKRVINKADPTGPHEVILVLDATLGQNALQQAKMFHEAIQIDSICLTKLDGTAKGGIIFAIHQELGLPIRYIGVGEQLEDLEPFSAEWFIEALFE